MSNNNYLVISFFNLAGEVTSIVSLAWLNQPPTSGNCPNCFRRKVINATNKAKPIVAPNAHPNPCKNPITIYDGPLKASFLTCLAKSRMVESYSANSSKPITARTDPVTVSMVVVVPTPACNKEAEFVAELVGVVVAFMVEVGVVVATDD